MTLKVGGYTSSQIGASFDRAKMSTEKALERLSSGMRINRASDDAAGLAISTSLRSDARTLNVARRNVNDGLSLLAVADSALESLTQITERISELANQAAHEGYTLRQRTAMDKEAQALRNEFLRIAESTTYNGTSLFGSSFGTLSLQVGSSSSDVISGTLGGVRSTGELKEIAGTSYSNYRRTPLDQILADLNNDGNQDLVSYLVNSTAGGTSSLMVRMGRGNGAFGGATEYTLIGTSADFTLTGIDGLDAGDLDGDGDLDLVATSTNDSGTGFVFTLTNRGNGTFTTSQTSMTGETMAPELGDVNGDDKLDLLYRVGSNFRLALGNGDGTFAHAKTITTVLGTGASDLELHDMNNDGYLDIVGVGRSTIPIVGIHYNRGDGTFANAVTYLTNDVTRAMNLTIGDINNDGYADVVTVGTSPAYTSIFLGTAQGTLVRQSQIFSSSAHYTLDLADMNGDGRLDLVGTAGGNTVHYYIGNGDGSFGTRKVSPSSVVENILSVVNGDLNNDGVTDIIAGGMNSGDTKYDAVVYMGQTTSGVDALQPISLKNAGDARAALTYMSLERERLILQRTQIGTFEKRLIHALSQIEQSALQHEAAASRITDVDIAEESATLVRGQIAQQFASFVQSHILNNAQLYATLLRN